MTGAELAGAYGMTTAEFIDTIRPDHPAESVVRVVGHYGDMRFVEVTSMTGPDEGWCLQLDAATTSRRAA